MVVAAAGLQIFLQILCSAASPLLGAPGAGPFAAAAVELLAAAAAADDVVAVVRND